MTVPIDPPPTLVPSTLTPAPGTPLTVTLSNGFGGSGDWLAFAATGSVNASYVSFAYVGTGVTNRTWTFTTPNLPGTYEFRLFLEQHLYAPRDESGGDHRREQSAADLARQHRRQRDVGGGGASLTATLTNAPGGQYRLDGAGVDDAGNTSYVQFIYVGAGVTTKTWTVTAPSTAGSYEFRLFANNGYTRLATSPTVVVSAGSSNPPPTSPASIDRERDECRARRGCDRHAHERAGRPVRLARARVDVSGQHKLHHASPTSARA